MKLTDIKLYSLAILFFVCTNIFSQKAENQVWHKGYIVLDNADTLYGLIRYDFKENYVEYQKGDDYRTLLPGKFSELYFTSSVDASTHLFNVLNIKTGEDYYRPYFFELVDTSGKVKIAKQYYWTEQSNNFGQIGGISFRLIKIETLYHYNAKKEAVYIRNRKRSILRIVADQKDKVKAEVKLQRYRYNNTDDIYKIIRYYNSLFL